MSKAAQSIQIFGFYLLVVGTGFLLLPELMTSLFGLAQPQDSWVRVVGALVIALGVYYLNAANNDLIPFMRTSIYVRFGILALFIVMVLLNMTQVSAILFGLVDAAGALWTRWALQQDGTAEAA